jgi:pyruvate dehydrogenase E2 component (dihydrolipoamide acetyltransferase)
MSKNIHAITLPKMGLTMESGSVAGWHVKDGANVNEGDEIADIETEKITAAYESPVSGIWRRSLATLGKDLPVGSLIGVVTDAEVSDADIDNFVETFKPKA